MIANLHHVDLALEYATRIVGVREGRIVYDIQVKDKKDRDIHQRPSNKYTVDLYHKKTLLVKINESRISRKITKEEPKR